MKNRKSRIIGFFVGFMLSCTVHGGVFLVLYKNFTFKKNVVALHEDLKAPLKMALTAFSEEQRQEYQEEIVKPEEPPKKDEPKPEEPPKEEPKPKPKLPEPAHQEIIKNEPVPVPIEPQIEQNIEDTTEILVNNDSAVQTQTAVSAVQAQNSGAEALSSSMVEDDHIIAIIRAAIDKEAKKDYPSKAKKLRMEGIAKVKIRIDQDGRITLLEITESSGFSMLDQSAIKSIQKASKNFPKPSKVLLFILPISYELV
jgi:protein TonB